MSRRKLFWLPSGSVLRKNKTSGYSISDLTSPPECSELRQVHGWRERSSSAAGDADVDNVAPLSVNRLKRIPKKERRAMVMAFVDKYRERNAGKFPTVSAARKQVGGSYYVTRKIIQELEYNSKSTSVNEIRENLSVPSRTKENNKPFSELVEGSGGQEQSNTSSAASLVSNAVDGLLKDSADTSGALRNYISNDGKPKIDDTYEELRADKMRMDDAVTHDLTIRSEFAGMRVSASQKVEDAKLDRDSKELAGDHLKCADSDKYYQEKDVQTATFNEDDSEFRAGPNPSSKMISETPWRIDKNEEAEKECNISAAKSSLDNESVDLYSITSDKSGQKTGNDEPKNSIWGNLKLIANNVIGIWKRLK